MYYTYMLRCSDNSIYTGMTNNLKRRMNEHFTQNEKCAKYTLTHMPIKLEVAWKSECRSMACKLEYHIKKLTKEEKENIIMNNQEFEILLKDKVNIEEYIKLGTNDINQ